MFEPTVYSRRRDALRAAMPGTLILFLGHDETPMDFRANVYPFRQDSCFRYFFGLDRPGLAGLIDADAGEDWLFGDDPGIDGTIWLGETESLAAAAERVAVRRTGSREELAGRLAQAADRPVLYPLPYRAETKATLDRLLGNGAANGPDDRLVRAIIALREIKQPDEIAEMEAGLAVTREMHHAAMALTEPGASEQAIVGRLEGMIREAGLRHAYQPIFSGRGEILHNLRYDRALGAGELVVHDAGVWSAGGYATDVTRTIPVSGRFDPLQARLYDAVLSAQTQAIEACRPGVSFLDIHLGAARVMVETLCDLGLFRGEPERVVSSGAYALAFPCGVGHQIGLDVHDMEALGEDRVGYDDAVRRSDLFGLKSLRLGKALRPGMTVTIEPGLYFIPQLIAMWRAEGRHGAMIDYDRFEDFAKFGGIRIEDDVLVTLDGSRVLGPPVAKERDEMEVFMNERSL
jgi:Xaa-Pro aminopeptidase/Xaa-Pro dipeptidase